MGDSINWYFDVGRSAMECIDCALGSARKSPSEIERILDLPCGFGRVLRYLKAGFPDAEITACDLNREGVDFCARELGAIPVYSEDDPARIPIERNSFDLIWVGSLFTHFDSDVWPGFLNTLHSFLRPGGVLVFTAHGRCAYHRIRGEALHFGITDRQKVSILYQYEHSGFGYTRYPYSDSYYGLSLSDPSWVFAQLKKIENLRVSFFGERSWADFHDVYACIRDDNWRALHPPISTFDLGISALKDRADHVRRVLRPRSRIRSLFRPKA